MSRPQSITIEECVVYNAEDLYNYDKGFFIGCSRIRTIIEKKKLRNEDYLFAYQKKGVWVKSTPNYPRAKLFLREEYVSHNVPKMMDMPAKELYKYEEAPPVLILRDEEKFRDANGNMIEIEVRGEREHNKCYFKVKDISVGFEMPSLRTTVLGDNSTYIKDVDYKTFIITSVLNINTQSSKINSFMTYEGIIKLLYVSRNDM